ncbi:MAG: hypothetical protein OEZ00_02970 [Dehalococcoidia bacterium]|nr:hypothetical protein [Dehalococcoidia bacterium]
MSIGKGYRGETCAEAIRTAIGLLGNHASAQDIFDEVRKMGMWTQDNIWQGLMEFVVNLPPSYRHWEGTRPEERFLFLREDGDYELYQPARHGRYEQGRRIS